MPDTHDGETLRPDCRLAAFVSHSIHVTSTASTDSFGNGLTHATCANGREDLVESQPSPRCQRHKMSNDHTPVNYPAQIVPDKPLALIASDRARKWLGVVDGSSPGHSR